jgi:glycosyltransferase involved in cell wall biosynthesis
VSVPSISVVIPTYDRAALLAETVAGVRAQTRAPDEIVIVDDGSSDGTDRLVASLGRDLRYLRQENRGPGAARNAGAAATTGELLAFLDSDDLWQPEHLDTLHALLTGPAGEGAGAVLAWHRLFDESRRSEDSELFPIFSCALVRRSAWEATGPIDPGLAIAEDLDWFFRLRERGLAVLVGDRERPTVWYRRHGASLTAVDRATLNRHVVLAMHRSLARRRASGARLAPLRFLHPEQAAPVATPVGGV